MNFNIENYRTPQEKPLEKFDYAAMLVEYE